MSKSLFDSPAVASAFVIFIIICTYVTYYKRRNQALQTGKDEKTSPFQDFGIPIAMILGLTRLAWDVDVLGQHPPFTFQHFIYGVHGFPRKVITGIVIATLIGLVIFYVTRGLAREMAEDRNDRDQLN